MFFIILAIWLKNNLLEQVAFANISLAAVSTIVAGIESIRDNIVFFAGKAANHIAKVISHLNLEVSPSELIVKKGDSRFGPTRVRLRW